MYWYRSIAMVTADRACPDRAHRRAPDRRAPCRRLSPVLRCRAGRGALRPGALRSIAADRHRRDRRQQPGEAAALAVAALLACRAHRPAGGGRRGPDRPRHRFQRGFQSDARMRHWRTALRRAGERVILPVFQQPAQQQSNTLIENFPDGGAGGARADRIGQHPRGRRRHRAARCRNWWNGAAPWCPTLASAAAGSTHPR